MTYNTFLLPKLIEELTRAQFTKWLNTQVKLEVYAGICETQILFKFNKNKLITI